MVRYPLFRFASRAMVVFVLVFTSAIAGHATTVAAYGGEYTNWPTVWDALTGLNDQDNGLSDAQLDFVGDATDPGAYYAFDDDYIYFRMRVDVGTVTSTTFEDTLLIMIDQHGVGTPGDPDYAFVWDTKGLKNLGEENQHGLELTVPDAIGASWSQTRFDDIDGNAAVKISPPDFNRTGDGYIRVTDSITTNNFGTTTYVDWAISWDYLTGDYLGAPLTTLAPNQTWSIQFGSIANATDHNKITYDVAGGDAPSSVLAYGDDITTTPEPGTIALLTLGLVGLLARRRKG